MSYSEKYPSAQELVKEFHTTYGQPVRNTPELNVPERDMRMALIEEEFQELKEASANNDLVEMVDAWGDLIYVIYGAALTHGVNLDEVLAEIQRSNLSKLDANGEPIFREDGKILKGPDFFAPDIANVLAQQAKSNVED